MSNRLLWVVAALALLACEDDRGSRPHAPADVPADVTVDAPADLPADVSVDAPADLPAEAPAGCSPPGSVCRPGRCEGDHFLPEVMCDQKGVCPPQTPIACNPTRCRNGSCIIACTSDDDCQAPAICQSGTCLARPFGCTQPDHCASGFCVEGACCDRACTSPCETCASPAARGRCLPRPASSQPDAGCAADARSAGT